MRAGESPSVADLVAKAGRSGAPLYLRVGTGDVAAQIWIEGGKVTAAMCEGAGGRLGARLVATGHLRTAELTKASARADGEGISLPQALAEKVRRDVLEHIATDEARYALAAALASPPGVIETGTSEAPADAIKLALDARELLREAQTFLDSVEAAQQAVPADAVLVIAESPGPGDILAPEETAVLANADGVTPVSRIAEVCGFPQPEVIVIAERLVRLGFVEVDEGAATTSALLAELEAAQDLADVSAAFEAACAAEEPEPEQELSREELDREELVREEPVREEPDQEPAALAEEPLAVAVEEPPAVQEPAAPTEAAAPPPIDPPPPPREAAAAAARADSSALLRELASLARGDEAPR